LYPDQTFPTGPLNARWRENVIVSSGESLICPLTPVLPEHNLIEFFPESPLNPKIPMVTLQRRTSDVDQF